MTNPALPTAGAPAAGWDCHVHVFDAAAPVRPGHYTPVDRPLAQIEQVAAGHGIGHLVLVQPSVYGTDNAVMLRALAVQPGRHRGVAVVEAGIGERELDDMHAAGVRGVRFNLVSPAGHAGDPSAELLQLAPRLRARGWHVQWYAPAEALPQLAAWQAQTGLEFVLDHLAGLRADLPSDHTAWGAAQALAGAGAWVKLSGWYRLGCTAPYAPMYASIQRAAALFGPRLLWGSDWPHTSFAPHHLPSYASVRAPVLQALGAAALDDLLSAHPAVLYGQAGHNPISPWAGS